jgi:hypothetical protein
MKHEAYGNMKHGSMSMKHGTEASSMNMSMKHGEHMKHDMEA